MRLLLRILLPILILGACAIQAYVFVRNKEAPPKFSPPPQITQVEGIRIALSDYQIYLETRGTVSPRTSTTLFPEVSGRIVSISPNFREGGFFEKDEVLLNIEKVDYETAVIIARSQVAQAKRSLEEEKMLGKQAAENWLRLGKSGTPSPMVLREPQMEEAKARIQAAEGEVQKALRNLDRTEIRAPYAGRILNQLVDVGQFVSPGTQLGRAFATDFMEVRLPLTNEQLGFVDLPETFRGDVLKTQGPEVTIFAQVGSTNSSWKGEIVRVDSAIDQMTRQLFVVAQIEDPYRREHSITPALPTSSTPTPGPSQLKIGMFVDVIVKGRNLQNVFVLPRSTVRVSDEVILIDENSKIRRQKVEPMFKSGDQVVFPAEGAGLSANDVVCLTQLSFPVNGTPVIAVIDGVAPKVEKIPGLNPEGKGKGKGSNEKSKETKSDRPATS